MSVRCVPTDFRRASNLGGGGHCGQRQNTSCELMSTHCTNTCIKAVAFYVTNDLLFLDILEHCLKHLPETESKTPNLWPHFADYVNKLAHTSYLKKFIFDTDYERFGAAYASLFQHDGLSESFFLLRCDLHLEHAVCWGPSVSRTDHFPPSQSQLLRHQREEEAQSASALHLHSCERYLYLSAISALSLQEEKCLRNGRVAERSTVPTQGSAGEVRAVDVRKYRSHLYQHKPHAERRDATHLSCLWTFDAS